MRDSYKVKQLTMMLAHETDPNEEHYGANLSHWYGDSKPLTIDAGGIEALIAYYSGSEHVEREAEESIPVPPAKMPSSYRPEKDIPWSGASDGMPTTAVGYVPPVKEGIHPAHAASKKKYTGFGL